MTRNRGRPVAYGGIGLLLLAAVAAAAEMPLAEIVLDDVDGQSRRLDALRDVPVLLVIADRRASEDAEAWGRRLASEELPVAPWATPGRVAWVTIADLRGVPEYARDDARARLREREARRGDDERRHRSPLLVDWEGRVAIAVGAERREVLVVVLSREHRELVRERGVPTDDGVRRVVEALRAAALR